MAIVYRGKPNDMLLYEEILHEFHRALDEYVYKTGKYPDKIVVTEPVYMLIKAHITDIAYLHEDSETTMSFMGISMDVVISKEWYFMIGDPIKLGGD